MIIFDLDGTLADCEHRRHFVDPSKTPGMINQTVSGPMLLRDGFGKYFFPNGDAWKPDWKAFYEACDQDKPIKPVLDAFIHLTQGEPFHHDVQIWSGRCESVREKTLKWLVDLTGYCEDYKYWNRRLKMRPVGDYMADDLLKEKWLDEYMFGEKCELPTLEGAIPCQDYQNNPIEFVFDDRPKVVRMWRRRGIFVFNCCQHDGEF